MNRKARKLFRQNPDNPQGGLVRQEYREIRFSGPLPTSSEFEKYEQICPGAADRILSMAEQQATHRHALESKVIASNVSNEKSGMWIAAILTGLLSVFGFYLILQDKNAIGLSLFSPVVFNAGNYIWQKIRESSKNQKLEE